MADIIVICDIIKAKATNHLMARTGSNPIGGL